MFNHETLSPAIVTAKIEKFYYHHKFLNKVYWNFVIFVVKSSTPTLRSVRELITHLNYTDMLTQKIQDALNAQVNAEIWSAYLYLSMSCHFENEGYAGIANWFKVQWKEELDHAEIFMNYINSRSGRVELKAIDAVPTQWDSILDAFKATLEHEQKVTAMINNIYALAEAENDYATRDRLNWFVSEQVEEEESARAIIDKVKMVGDNGMGRYMIDQELGARTYSTPSPLATAAD